MKHHLNVVVVSCLSLSCAALLSSCGGSGSNDDPSANSNDPQNPTLPGTPQNQPNPQSMGAVNFSCNGASGASQQEMPYQQQQQGCKKGLRFEQKRFSDLDINLDCNEGVVRIQNKGSPDEKSKALPIADDGSVQGQLQYQQKIKGDGYGHDQDCWIEYDVRFDGKANCDDDSGKKTLSLKTAVAFNKADSEHIAADIGPIPPTASPTPSLCPGPMPSDSPTPCPSPSPSVSPSPSPSESPSPFPTPSYSPTFNPTPSPSLSISPLPEPSFTIQPTPPQPHPTVVPVVVCEVPEETCEYDSSTDLSCPQ